MNKWLKSERGAGMILVVGFSGAALSLVATALVMSTTAIEQSRLRSDHEISLAAAETGIDWTLARVQHAYISSGSDFPIPGTQSGALCPGAPVAQQSFTTPDAEADWARQNLEAMAAEGCLQQADGAEYAVLKPASPTSGSVGRIYALGWSPSRDAPRSRQRLIKVEYQFLPFTATHAVLTQGNLSLDSSVTIESAAGYDPTLAGIHTNGAITSTGNPVVTGPVTSTGTSTASSNNFTYNVANYGTGGVQSGTAQAFMPTVSAAAMYRQVMDTDPAATATWFDLCPDGTVRPYSESGPCQSSETYGAPAATFDAGTHTWTISGNASSGTYYAHEGNIQNGVGNHEFENLTLIAAAAGAEQCSTKQYGNIMWDHYEINAPAVLNTFMVADGDLSSTSNFEAGSNTLGSVIGGVFVAGNQISLNTSSQAVVGAIIAADQCSNDDASIPAARRVTSNEVKNVTIRFDPASRSPFATVANQNLWLEMSAP